LLATAAIVLAAGQGTRMRSQLPKVLHPLAGRPMLLHVLDAVRRAGIEHCVVVTGHGADQVERSLDGTAATIRQEPQLGTADAVRVGMERVPAGVRHVLVTNGDVPLLPANQFAALLHDQAEGEAVAALLTARMPDPTGYGRIVRDAGGRVTAIIEEADADAITRAIDEVNVGTYCFDAAWLRANVGDVPASASSEFYLTDLISLAVGAGRHVLGVPAPRPELTIGINDRVALSAAEQLLRREIAERHMLAGVTIVDPASTWIDAGVEIGQDTRIEPGTRLVGRTVIGQDAVIGPDSFVRDSQIGPRTTIWASVVEESSVAEEVQIGPFSHLRPGTQIGPRCRIGNFAEIKKSRLGEGTQQHHFSYLGDAEIGERVNVGAGSITANYDGERKNVTRIGDDVSLGVDSMLVAPVSLGDGSRTGAGAVVTRDVAPGKTVVGIPARPIEARRRRSAERALEGAPADDRNSQTGGEQNPVDA
jgi:bifunctional UDP-N-acetylglucosamine pyrophosphorylase/glucosamine-1-phosphate N-acetyltransferase